ncbi:MAG: hypothetical protein AB7G75_08775 [Candidatus Binatia bacterium]
MEETQSTDPQPTRLEQLKARWQTIDKKKFAMIGGIVVTISALLVAGLRKGVLRQTIHK